MNIDIHYSESIDDNNEERVVVLFDFEYSTDEAKVVHMKKGEQLVVLKKTNPDWWQCRRRTADDALNDNDMNMNDNQLKPFYAPVSYLKELIVDNNNINNNNKVDFNSNNKSNDKKKNISTIKVGLSFTNPLSSGFGNEDNNSESDPLDQTNGTINSSKESLIDSNDSCDNNYRLLIRHNRSVSPCYANLPLMSGNNPPKPDSKVSPIRILLNHWAEYEDNSGRKFYYNSLSRETSWKPPRRKPCDHSRDDELMTSHSEENLTDSSSTSLSTTPNTSLISNSSPIPKPKSQWRRFVKNNNRNEMINNNSNSKSAATSPPTLPKGWTRKHNEETKEIYFINDKTNGKIIMSDVESFTDSVSDSPFSPLFCDSGELFTWEEIEKWFCKLDENGRLYFFEENGKESYWELPDAAPNDDSSDERPTLGVSASHGTNAAKCGTSKETKSPDNTIKKMSKLSTNQRSLLERNIKARSMAFLPVNSSLASRPNIPAILLQEDNQGTEQEPVIPVFQPPPTCLDDCLKILKQGVLNRTKLIEGGKRIRKNWSNCYIALTDFYLLFFKDAKSAQSGSKPEITIELAGAMITWCPEKSSRKNCFQVSTITGHQVLLQEECALTCKEWFDLIKSAILRLPTSVNYDESDKDNDKGFKLKRSKSTKQYRRREDTTENELSAVFIPLMTSQSASNIPSERRKKIKERLRQFLRRRPTLESLREKGIFKDEPVFGGKLEILCLRDKQTVPKFVQQCIQAIEAKDLRADGLYRACGNLSQVQKLRFQINQDDFSGIWSEDDVHVLTGLLKMFFRDMKEPLFPCDRFEPLMKMIVLSDRKTQLELLTKLVKELPRPNYDTLKYILSHLLRVKEHSDENRMHIQNLAIVFGPTLMWPENDSNNFALDMMLRMHQNQIIEFLLLEFDHIFT